MVFRHENYVKIWTKLSERFDPLACFHDAIHLLIWWSTTLWWKRMKRVETLLSIEGVARWHCKIKQESWIYYSIFVGFLCVFMPKNHWERCKMLTKWLTMQNRSWRHCGSLFIYFLPFSHFWPKLDEGIAWKEIWMSWDPIFWNRLDDQMLRTGTLEPWIE